jgi:hypothetical protein
MGLHGANARARVVGCLSSLGLVLDGTEPTGARYQGRVLCDYHRFKAAPGRESLSGILTVWRPERDRPMHVLRCYGTKNLLCHEESTDLDWLLRCLTYAKLVVAPKVNVLPPKEAGRQAKDLMLRFTRLNPPPREVKESEGPRDFLRNLGRKLIVSRADFGHYTQVYRRYGSSTLTSIGHQITMYKGVQSELLRLIRDLLEELSVEKAQRLAQHDIWSRPEATHAIHRALGELIGTGELEEGPSCGDWNYYRIPVRHVGVEEAEQMPLLNVPASFAPGTARKFIAGLPRGYRVGSKVSSGRSFRRLVGQFPNKGVYIWKQPGQFPRAEGVLVVVLMLPTAHGNGQSEWPVQQDWASFSHLADRLRTWRNLEGSNLFINGVPAGKVGFRNSNLRF